MKRISFAAAVALISAIALSAWAATTTSTFTVTMTVLSTCVAASTPLEFGTTAGEINNPVDATTSVAVTCTSGTPYALGLSAGSGDGADYATRLLTNTSDATTASYSLFTDETYSTVWNDTDQTVTGLGDGEAQSIPVYGRVFAPQTVAQGVYTDTIVATVTF
ncbi:MAG: Csu type fimbrial protein [Oceanococcus sp.]